MALIIGPQEESAGGSIGKALGAGLGNALQGLAQGKIKQMQSEHTKRSLISAGVHPEDAELIARFPEDMQVKLIQGLWQRGPRMQDPKQPQVSPQQVDPREQLQQAINAQFGIPNQQGGMANLMQGLQSPQQPQVSPQQVAMMQQQAQQQQPSQQPSQKPYSSFYAPPRDEQRKVEELDIKKQRLEIEREKAIAAGQKALRPEIIEARKKAMVADLDLDALDSFDKIINTGDLRSPQAQALFEKLGIEGFVPDTKVEYAKKIIAQQTLRSFQNGTGSKQTVALLEKIGESLQSLLNTPEGNRIVGETLRIPSTEDKLFYQEVRKIGSENKGVYPQNVLEEAYDRIQPKVQKLIENKNDKIDKILKGNNFSVGSTTNKLPPVSSIPIADRNNPRFGYRRGDGKIFVIRHGSWQEHK